MDQNSNQFTNSETIYTMYTQSFIRTYIFFALILIFSISQLAAGVVGGARSTRGQGGNGDGSGGTLAPDNILLSAELIPDINYETSYDPTSNWPEIYNFDGLKSVTTTQDIILTFEDPVSWQDLGPLSLDFRYIAYDEVRYAHINNTAQGADSRTLVMTVQVIHYSFSHTHQSGDYKFRLKLFMGLLTADFHTATFEYALVPPSSSSGGRGGWRSRDIADFSSESFSLNLLPSSNLMNLLYTLPEEAKVSAELYTINGVRVKKLILPSIKPAGQNKKSFDVSNLSPGFYFIRFRYNGIIKSLKFIKS